jgi:hypothetical protein
LLIEGRRMKPTKRKSRNKWKINLLREMLKRKNITKQNRKNRIE